MNQPLSWGLIIATYQREQVLLECLKLAVEQTWNPAEIIVVDASKEWQNTHDRVMADIASMSLWSPVNRLRPNNTHHVPASNAP